MTIPVFYSFHYANDVFRVNLVRNIGALDDNKPVSENDWEQVKRRGNAAIQNWIDENMKWRRCVIVLIGSQTYYREWVRYEIKKAWDSGKGLLGIYIHNLNSLNKGTSPQGLNPFSYFHVGQTRMDQLVPCYDPGFYAYTTISQNMESWVNTAVSAAAARR